MKIIITQDDMTLIAQNIVEIRTMLINIDTNSLSDYFDDDMDVDAIEFAIVAFTVNDGMNVLGIYATEEERNYAKYKLDMYLSDTLSNKFTMPERK